MMPVDLSEIAHNGRTPSQRCNYTPSTTLSDCGRFFAGLLVSPSTTAGLFQSNMQKWAFL